MSKSFSGPVAELLPHRPPMLLVDELLNDTSESVEVATRVRRDALFTTDEGWPAWVGAELMAQTIGVWGGLYRLRMGQAVQIGFFLGTRRYESSVQHFPVGAQLVISAELELASAQGLGVFNCVITMNGEAVATASLNVFQPPDIKQYLTEVSGA